MAEATFPLYAPPGAPSSSSGSEATPGVRLGSGLSDGDGALGQILDHCAEAQAHLLEVHKNKPRTADLVCTLAEQCDQVETALWALFTERGLSSAVGVQLDGIGEIVGEPRKDRTDDVYRVFLGVRILVNRSDGKTRDLYAILRQAFGADTPMSITEHYPAAIQVSLLADIGDVTAEGFVLYLRQAKGGAVRLEFVYTVEPLVDTFLFNSSESGQCLGSTVDPTLGGVFAGVM